MSKYVFESEGTEYTMEFDRETVERSERLLGIKPQTVTEYSVLNAKALFHASLLKHHPKMKASTVDRLFAAQGDKQDMYADLVEMYAEAYESLMVDAPGENPIKRRKID